MSYYAFFKWWLLLSQHPGCLSLPTSFPTLAILWDLSWRSGLFPSPRRTLAPAVCLLDSTYWYSSLWRLVSRWPPALTVLYPKECPSSAPSIAGRTSYLRVWLAFHPSHKSSANFSTLVGSVLQLMLAQPSTCPWLDHRVSSGLILAIKMPVKTRFPTAPQWLTRHKIVTGPIIQYASDHEQCSYWLLHNAVHGFRFYFTPLTGVLSPFLTVPVHHRSVSSICISEDGPPPFRQDITCPALLVFTRWWGCRLRGYHPFIAALSRAFVCLIKSLYNPISLAATFGISVDFSPGYLDVSVPPVCLLLQITTRYWRRKWVSIRKSQTCNDFYCLIWAYSQLHVLHRLQTSQASISTLSHLTIQPESNLSVAATNQGFWLQCEGLVLLRTKGSIVIQTNLNRIQDTWMFSAVFLVKRNIENF